MTSSSLPSQVDLAAHVVLAAEACGVDIEGVKGQGEHRSPINGESLGQVAWIDTGQVESAVSRFQDAFRRWSRSSAPARGQVIRRFADLLTEHKTQLAALVSAEIGKISSEAAGARSRR